MIIIDVVTPTKKLVDGGRTGSIKLPSSLGEIEVLPGHTEVLTLLSTGVVSFVQDTVERRFAVSYGFAEIRNDKVLVLAETAEESKDIDRLRAELAQKKAEEELSSSLTEEKFKKYQLKLQRAIIRQQVSQ